MSIRNWLEGIKAFTRLGAQNSTPPQTIYAQDVYAQDVRAQNFADAVKECGGDTQIASLQLFLREAKEELCSTLDRDNRYFSVDCNGSLCIKYDPEDESRARISARIYGGYHTPLGHTPLAAPDKVKLQEIVNNTVEKYDISPEHRPIVKGAYTERRTYGGC